MINSEVALNHQENKILDRKSNIELLRILAMFMIILSHMKVDFSTLEETYFFNSFFFENFINFVFGKVGVTLFIMISGYFLCTSKFKFSSIFRLILQVEFYSVLSYFIGVFTGYYSEFSITGLFDNMLVITNREWWFFSMYFVLYLIFPFLNIIIKKLNHKQFLFLLVVLGFYLSFIYTVVTYASSIYSFNIICYIIFIYFVGAFVRLYPNFFKNNLIISLGLILIFITYIILICLGYRKITANTQSFAVLMLSLFIFLLFKNINFKCRFINLISSTTFGVYLLHDCDEFKIYLWENIVKLQEYINSKNFILICYLVAIIIFIVCSLFELLRNLILEKPIFKFLNKNKGYKNLTEKIDAFFPNDSVSLENNVEPKQSNQLLINLLIVYSIFVASLVLRLVIEVSPYKIFIVLSLLLCVLWLLTKYLKRIIKDIKQ